MEEDVAGNANEGNIKVSAKTREKIVKAMQ